MASINDFKRTDFNFNGRWLSEFGGILYSDNVLEEINAFSGCEHNVTELQDGTRYYTGYTIKPKTEKLKIFFKEEIDIDDLVNWLDLGECDFYYDDNTNRKLKCILNTNISITVAFKPKFRGKLEIEMIAYEPYWYEVEPRYLDIKNPVKGQSYNFYYDGTEKGYATIQLKANGKQENVKINFAGKEFIIKEFTDNLTIEFRNLLIYSIQDKKKINKYSDYEVIGGREIREQITLETLKNNTLIVKNGDLTNIKIKFNTCWR